LSELSELMEVRSRTGVVSLDVNWQGALLAFSLADFSEGLAAFRKALDPRGTLC